MRWAFFYEADYTPKIRLLSIKVRTKYEKSERKGKEKERALKKGFVKEKFILILLNNNEFVFKS